MAGRFMKVCLGFGVAVMMVAAGVYARGPSPGGMGPPPPPGGQFQQGQQPPGQPGGQQPGGQQFPGQPGQQPPGQPGQQPPGQSAQATASSLTPDDLLNNSSLNLTSDQKAEDQKSPRQHLTAGQKGAYARSTQDLEGRQVWKDHCCQCTGKVRGFELDGRPNGSARKNY